MRCWVFDIFFGLVVAAVFALVAGGCGTVTESLNLDGSRPTSAQRALAGPPTAIAVGYFAEPQRGPVPVDEVGSGMSDALSRSLLKGSRFDVWMNQELAGRLNSPSPDLQRIGNEFPQLRYVVTGRVTDFVQTTDLPESLRSKGWFGRRKNEAVVSMVLRVTDLESGRVIATDRFTGRASVAERASSEMYKHVAFGSHLFWSTPLGQASREAISQATKHIERLVPVRREEPRIASRLSGHRVRIDGGRLHGLKPGQEYHLYRAGRSMGDGPVRDNVTDRPVVARIDTVEERRATAWLLGRPDREIELRGMRLRPGGSDRSGGGGDEATASASGDEGAAADGR